MIGFFPTPYPDELLYSACARYTARTGYVNKQRAKQELFGTKGVAAIVDFPNRLEELLSLFPPHNYTADGIIDENTLFPFHEPFISIDKANQVRGEMKFSKENHIRARLAVNIPQVATSEYLRFCPLCVEDDRKIYGETFWHRIHQLGGLMVCAKHKCFLQNSTLKWERQSGYGFYSAEDSLNLQPVQYIRDEDFEHQTFLYLSENAEWLLKQTNLCLDEGALRERYYNLLLKNGFAYYNGRIRNNKLFDAFNEYFSPSTLKKLGCTVHSAQRGWLAKFTEKQRANVLHHPVRHLLVMKFLGQTSKEFLKEFTEFKPFGTGPYPCLNKAADHRNEFLILDCEVFNNFSKDKDKSGRPLGVFTCDCGFVYQRIGPDSSEEKRFTYSLVREYGKTWENRLTELWANLSLSTSEIGLMLGVSQLSVVRHAIRLNLPMNQSNSRIVQGYKRHRNPNKPYSDLMAQYRQNWLQVIEKNPTLTRKELQHKEGFLYLWLRRNDSDWLEQHLPDVQQRYRGNDILNWSEIDEELSNDVEETCREIFASSHPLKRVCANEITKRIGNKTWIDKREQKLPKTNKIINKYSESWEAFMLRKINFAEIEYINKAEIPSRAAFLRYARLKNKTCDDSQTIQNAVTCALENIRSSVEQN
jgi:hypothetical protein